MRSFLLSLLMGLLFSGNAHSQITDNTQARPPMEEMEDEDDQPIEILSDTTLYISKREVSFDSVLAWKKEDKFGYVSQLDSQLRKEKQENTSGVKNERENAEKNDVGKNNRFTLSPAAQYILWGIASLFVLFILFSLVKSKAVFKRQNALKNPDWIVPESEKEDHVLEAGGYPALITLAVSEEKFRLAIRYQFLHLLQRLEEKDMLQLSREKTNAAYIQEISPDLRNAFRGLVQIYEQAWYGHVSVTAPRYHEIAHQFNLFIS